LEILNILWEIGPAELRLVHAALNARRKVATTTVATMLGVMLDKGLVRRSGGQRGYLWAAAVTRENAARGMVGKIVDRLFDGSTGRLVAHLLEEGELTEAERREIQRLLSSAKTPAKPKKGEMRS
jgi:predicted transcriptional regulator